MNRIKTLDLTRIGEKCKINGFADNTSKEITDHLTTLGFIPGEEITTTLKSPGGDPTSYIITGSVQIALRTKDAKRIIVE